METENTNPTGSSGNRTLLFVGGAFALLCLCVLCIGVGFFLYNSGTFAGLAPAEEPTPVPTFAMPTIPPVPTLDITPADETAESSSTALSNVRTAADQEGVQPKEVFGSFDTVYLVGDLVDAVAGDAIKSTWYAENVVGITFNSFIDESTITVSTDPVDYVYFFFEPPTDGWPSGIYKVEVHFNDVLHTTLRFIVQ